MRAEQRSKWSTEAGSRAAIRGVLKLIPRLTLAVQVEKNVTVVSKALTKVGRFFEANGLDGCSKIASTVKEQVVEQKTPASIVAFPV